MRHVALLRAVNLPGHNKVAMADLRALLEELGLDEPRSLLQSGNLVFGAERATPGELEAMLAREAEARLGLATDFFVRTAAEWRAIIETNPFPSEAEEDPSHLLVLTVKEAPSPDRVARLQAAIKGRERARAVGRQAYVVYPDGIGRSKLTAKLIERHLETSVTGRNWNTVLKLQALLERAGPPRRG